MCVNKRFKKKKEQIKNNKRQKNQKYVNILREKISIKKVKFVGVPPIDSGVLARQHVIIHAPISRYA